MYQEQFPVFLGPASSKATVIYHDHCNDGFGAAWAFHQRAALHYTDVAYIAMSYGQPPNIPELAGTDVFILDFSFPPVILTSIIDVATHTVLLDHHKTAIESLSDMADTWEKAEIHLHNGFSGAMLAWKYFSSTPAPRMIEYIQDRDLWQHKLPYTKEINALIAMTNRTFNAYTSLHKSFEQGQFYQCVGMGELLLKQYDRIVGEIVEATMRPIRIMGYEGMVCNCPGNFASDVGNILAKHTGTFGATYFAAKDGSHKFSLRSVGEFDVSRIAKEFGGGGHRNAAGFSLAVPIDDAGGSGVTIWNIG